MGRRGRDVRGQGGGEGRGDRRKGRERKEWKDGYVEEGTNPSSYATENHTIRQSTKQITADSYICSDAQAIKNAICFNNI